MMHSYVSESMQENGLLNVLILVLMDDALVRNAR